MIDGRNQVAGRGGQKRVELDVDLRPVLLDGPLVAAPDSGKANIGRSSFPCSANQCQVAGLTSPLGSQNEVAGTRQRRSSNEPRQNLLSMILSSRTLVTRRGARSFWCSTKPQLIKNDLSPSELCRMTGATCPGKIADNGSNTGKLATLVFPEDKLKVPSHKYVAGSLGQVTPYMLAPGFFFRQGASRCQFPAMMQPIGSIVSTTSARPNSAICARTAAAFL